MLLVVLVRRNVVGCFGQTKDFSGFIQLVNIVYFQYICNFRIKLET